ncbi:hypothetical protein QE152_g11041 [Popillia japonica]|uniref:CCHC-type domain-containing protein n=1 Tax=Popillia japonica TaxID=7064 RepID=A0AAW1LNF3_POPJA
MSDKEAELLLQQKQIKIGWTQCRIVGRPRDTRCYRCWGSGETRAACTGPDRGNLYLKCGKGGHKAIECPNRPYCINCQQEGHQTGTQKCEPNKAVRKAEALNEPNIQIQGPPNQHEP